MEADDCLPDVIAQGLLVQIFTNIMAICDVRHPHFVWIRSVALEPKRAAGFDFPYAAVCQASGTVAAAFLERWLRVM